MTACTTIPPLLPADYAGPVAILKDSSKESIRDKNADMFYAEAVNGQLIESSRNSTASASAGQGRNLSVRNIERKIPIQPLTVNVTGRTVYAAPIDALIRAVYEVKGVIAFTPEENKIYTVRGILGEKYSAVWIEEGPDKKIVGEKIEIKGSAKLGVLDK